jgi:hypothetical protein
MRPKREWTQHQGAVSVHRFSWRNVSEMWPVYCTQQTDCWVASSPHTAPGESSHLPAASSVASSISPSSLIFAHPLPPSLIFPLHYFLRRCWKPIEHGWHNGHTVRRTEKQMSSSLFFGYICEVLCPIKDIELENQHCSSASGHNVMYLCIVLSTPRELNLIINIKDIPYTY